MTSSGTLGSGVQVNEMAANQATQISGQKSSTPSRRSCKNCGKYHAGKCRVAVTCFHCHQPGHFRKNYPKLNQLSVTTSSAGSAAGSHLV